MNPVPTTCPICSEILSIQRLHCRNCDTSIEGHFELGRLGQLSQDQLNFVETFVRCEGKLNRLEKELGISYPTLRTRLTEVIRAMGFEVISDYAGQPGGLSDAERSQILDQLDRGDITSEEALALLGGED